MNAQRTVTSLLTVGALLGASALLAACSSDTSDTNGAEAPAEASAAPAAAEASAAPAAAESREAYFGTRNVRICVSAAPTLTETVDVAAMQYSKGTAVTFPDDGVGPECYVSDNAGFEGYAGVNLLFETDTIVVFGLNGSLQRPDLMLCESTTTSPGEPVHCKGRLDFKTFSEGDTKTMSAKGHTFTAKRENNTSDYIEFTVTINS